MKTKTVCQTLLKATVVAMFVMIFGSQTIVHGQSSADLQEFKITIELTDNGLQLHSDKGSAWIDLSFSIASGELRAIDEYGMTEPGKVSTIKDSKISDYLFTITRTKEGIVLNGLQGTAWKELSFSLHKNEKRSINQLGMTD
jgi:hypothetical protein